MFLKLQTQPNHWKYLSFLNRKNKPIYYYNFVTEFGELKLVVTQIYLNIWFFTIEHVKTYKPRQYIVLFKQEF